MVAPQLIAVSPPGSGTPLLARITTALGYIPQGTMSALADDGGDRGPGPGEVYPLLAAAHGSDGAAGLLHDRRHEGMERLQEAYEAAVGALWRVWWQRLGQPVTAASPVRPSLTERLARTPDAELLRLLPGHGCWYLTGLRLDTLDGGLLRHWAETGRPPLIYHHRDIRDRIITTIEHLSRPDGQVGTLPDHLVYRDILATLPTMDAKITLALTDPDFPGIQEARRCQWLARHPAVRVIRHEDLVGPALGGTAEAREQAVTTLLAVTGHSTSDRVALPPPPDSGTAATLAVGVWRTHFTPAHQRLLDRYHSDLACPLPLPPGPAVPAESPSSGREAPAPYEPARLGVPAP
ncbi:hypothetical protein [Streptomyces tsukubensis]|uniref:Uncharacterized protein n=1 Tax=Streptomyces tsukubensis TaxID=83656 RepID=A0A1V4A9E3_9ACTN|nr:hypothetical protein [Streptomyces tsukubensis]OON80116.1 hypothetical protein B1H18_13140 [Streptomyces tsukubensis]QFR97345.1 hypothetical protein GBW32_35110 [Streptomyces tsukubensis]